MRRTVANARPRLAARASLAALALCAGLLGGCYTEGGGQMSMDRFTYVSTPSQPKTITLVDTRTFESIWSIDVPVGQQVALQFMKNPKNREGIPPDPYRPDLMRWSLMKAYDMGGDLDNSIAVPPSYSRRLEMKLRPSPEMPDPAATLPGKSVKQLGYNDDSQPEFKKKPAEQPPPPAAAPAAAQPSEATPPPAPAAQPMPADPAPAPAEKPADPPVDLPK